MNSIFNSNTNFNLNFLDQGASSFSNQSIDGITSTNSAESKVINNRQITVKMDISITLNNNLTNSSKEYITATIMHEALHAYLRYSHTIVNQHLDMARNYINTMSSQLMKIYPNLSASDAKALTWGGLETDAGNLYTSLSEQEKSSIATKNKNYKNGIQGKQCNTP